MPTEKQNWERDHPAKPLSIERVQSLLAPLLGHGRVTQLQLLKGGLMNRNIRVHYGDEPRTCVLRLSDRDPSVCGKEVAILNRIRLDVPVPEVLYANVSGDADEPPFVVLSEVRGSSLFALRSAGNEDAVAGVSYDAGRVLARTVAFQFDRAGELTPNLEVEPRQIHAATTADVVDHFMHSPFFQQRVLIEDCKRLERFVRDREADCNEPYVRPNLVHGDFNSANVFGEQVVGGAWRVSAVLDWEFARSGSFYCDVGNFVRYHRESRPRYAPDFSRGLRDEGIDVPANWLAIARLADLPALCELLARPRIPDVVAEEVRELLLALLEDRAA